MKKMVLLAVFFSLVLSCYAQEWLKTEENNVITPLYSGLSLSLFGFDNGLGVKTNLFSYPIMNTVRTDNSTVWGSANFRITKLADYTNEKFVDTDIGPWLLLGLGIVSIISGPIMMATSGGGDNSGLLTGGIIVFSLGFSFITGEILWLTLR